jgi:phosphoribosylaminoimidazolecarboxamide formyltransferase / IMP cyclohydrolase
MKKIQSALISVFYKDGLEKIIRQLHDLGVVIYSTGGTQRFIEDLNIPCVPVESLTGYPSILGGRVKTLHPSVFGGILGRRDNKVDLKEMADHKIPEIDLVIVDLYPFQETVENVMANDPGNEKAIIEKIDIGGPSMIRAAAKNHSDTLVVASKKDYALLEHLLAEQKGQTSLEQRRIFAIKAFDVCTEYDTAISNYFSHASFITPFNREKRSLRYGENPHQPAAFYGNLDEIFEQLNGKEISYNNLVDIDAAINLIREFTSTTFAIIKHTNVCGVAYGDNINQAWKKALEGDPESAFGGVLVCNAAIDNATAEDINDLFFEVLIAPSFDETAIQKLKSKKNRIILKLNEFRLPQIQFRSILNGVLTQENDLIIANEWNEAGGRESGESRKNEKQDLEFANIVCKHLKSNAIALVKNGQLVGKGCGQTSRIDALRQSIEKAKQFNFDLNDAVLASDAFFPFDDCVRIAHGAGITAFIQPGGSIRDADSIEYCKQNGLVMVLTGTRHFKH